MGTAEKMRETERGVEKPLQGMEMDGRRCYVVETLFLA